MYKVDTINKELQPLEPIKSFGEIGITERYDIQEWLVKSPQVFGVEENALLILSKELPVSGKDERGIRLDLLALDRKGNLVVIELKRDEARGDIDWQAIKYAARCSKYEPEEIVRLLSEHENYSTEKARKAIIEHIEGEEKEKTEEEFYKLFSISNIGLDTRIILVAREFNPDICAAVAWLRENKIDISCIKLKPYRDASGELYITSERILPLPEMSDLIDYKNKIPRKSVILQENGRPIYSTTVPEMKTEELKNNLLVTLQRNSKLTPRLVEFLKIISDGKEHDREDLKLQLNKTGFFGAEGDLGQTGRLLSNISQFITKPASGHLRQIIEYTGEDDIFQAGQRKTSYKVKEEYLGLLKEVLSPSDNA